MKKILIIVAIVLVLAAVVTVNVLSVDRICVVQHTDCAMAGHDDMPIRDAVAEVTGEDASGWDFCSMPDQMAALHDDVGGSHRIFQPDGAADGVVAPGKTGYLLFQNQIAPKQIA